jgi:hypothetical protein
MVVNEPITRNVKKRKKALKVRRERPMATHFAQGVHALDELLLAEARGRVYCWVADDSLC